MTDLKAHKWWHWWFERTVSITYRFVNRWYGWQVQYQKVYCSLCKRVVRNNYEDAE